MTETAYVPIRYRRVTGRREGVLINTSLRRSNSERVRYIKAKLRKTLSLSDNMATTVAEPACLEERYAPVGTMIGLLQPDAPQIQYKLQKPMDAVDARDLVQICTAWDFDAQTTVLEPFT